MWKELLAYFTKQFIKEVGRRPQTTKELMSIQDDVVRYLNKTKGVPEGPKKPPFQGFTPKVIEGGKSKEGIGTLLKDSPEAIAKMKADNKAALERLKKKKMEDRALEDYTDDFTDDPGGMASGGTARVGYAGGKLVKGASWVINKLKEQRSQLKKEDFMGKLSNVSSTQKDFYKKELNTLIKQLEQGGEIPKEMLDTMIADPKFKSVVQTRSTDKDLFELEGVLLDRQAGKQSDELFYADRRKTSVWTEEYQKNLDNDVMKEYGFSKKEFNKLSEEAKEKFRKQLDGNYASAMEDAGETVINDPRPIQSDDLFDAEGKLNKKAVLQEVKDSEEKMLLDKFDVKGRTKQASGGRIGFADGDEVFDPLEGAFDDILEDIKKQRRKRKAEELKDLKNWDPQSPTYHASGGRAGSGLNYLLGEDDQNVRTPYGGLPGLLGE